MSPAILIVVRVVLLKPSNPDHFNVLLPLSNDWPCALIVNGDHKYINNMAIPVRMCLITLRGENHNVWSSTNVDNIRPVLKIIGCIVDLKGSVPEDLAIVLDLQVEHILVSELRLLCEDP